MSEQLYFTMAELVELWLKKHPGDANSGTLVIDACGGYVRTPKGFIWGAYYFAGVG